MSQSFRPSCRLRARLAFLCALVLAVAACDSPTEPIVNVPYSSTDLVVGTGAAAAAGSVVTVHWRGWIYSMAVADRKGTQIGTSIGGPPSEILIDESDVLPGLVQGLPGMRVGGTRVLVLPPNLAYGSAGSGSIPPFATLIFEFQLIDVQ